MRKPPTVEARLIDKTEAQDLLLKTPQFQRKVNTKVVQYQRDMDEGYWHPFVALVALDRRDNLINGQHVLTAFIRSKLDRLGVILATDYPTEAYAGFDKTRTRTASDDLRTMGYDKPTELAAVGKILWQWRTGVFDKQGWMAARTAEKIPTPAESIEMVKRFPDLQQHLIRNPFPGTGLAIVELRAVSYLLHQWDKPRAEEFLEMLIEGIGIPSKHHPIAVIRRAIQDSGGDRWRHGETMARLFKAWKAFIGECADASFRKGEAFPIPSIEPPPKPAAKKGSDKIQ